MPQKLIKDQSMGFLMDLSSEVLRSTAIHMAADTIEMDESQESDAFIWGKPRNSNNGCKLGLLCFCFCPQQAV